MENKQMDIDQCIAFLQMCKEFDISLEDLVECKTPGQILAKIALKKCEKLGDMLGDLLDKAKES